MRGLGGEVWEQRGGDCILQSCLGWPTLEPGPRCKGRRGSRWARCPGWEAEDVGNAGASPNKHEDARRSVVCLGDEPSGMTGPRPVRLAHSEEAGMPGKSQRTYETICRLCWGKHRNGSENRSFCYECTRLLDELARRRANNVTPEATPLSLERALESWGM